MKVDKMIEKEFKLSEKRILKPYGMSHVYPEEDVKEFIKRLKEELFWIFEGVILILTSLLKIFKFLSSKFLTASYFYERLQNHQHNEYNILP